MPQIHKIHRRGATSRVDRLDITSAAFRPGASAMRAALAPFARKRPPGNMGGTVRLDEAPRASAQSVTAVAAVVSTKRAPVALEDHSATISSETSESSATCEELTALGADAATTTQGGPPNAELARTLESAVADDELATVKSPPIDLATVPAPVVTRPPAPPPVPVPAAARAPAAAPIPWQRLPDMTHAAPRSRSVLIAAVVFLCVAGVVAIALYMSLHATAPK